MVAAVRSHVRLGRYCEDLRLGALSPVPDLADIDAVQSAFADHGYVADRDLATAVFLSLALGRPLLLEGEAGVGKTEVARTLAAALGAQLIRLQCYEGLDVNTRGLRVGLPAPDARDPAARGPGRGQVGRRPATSSPRSS